MPSCLQWPWIRAIPSTDASSDSSLVTALANGPGIIGMDISEIAPIEGFAAPQFTVARLIYRMLGRIRAGQRHRRRKKKR